MRKLIQNKISESGEIKFYKFLFKSVATYLEIRYKRSLDIHRKKLNKKISERIFEIFQFPVH